MQKKQIWAIYIAGLVQGLALVAFPSSSRIFTSIQGFNFSDTGYGGLFIPQAVLSILASLLSTKLARRGKIKPIFLIGLFANLLSMTLFALSALAMHHFAVAYLLLLVATGSLGIGFGLTVPSLNTFAALLFPKKVDSAILILNALLGVGTALSPLFVALFIGFGIWWGLPLLLAFCLALLIFFSFPLSLPKGKDNSKVHQKPIPARFWLFAIFALLYGIIETINGNWSTVYMSQTVKASAAYASLALTLFWSMVTVGRVLFAAIQKVFPERATFHLLPFIAMGAFCCIGFLSPQNTGLNLMAFALAGFGCSALLPLTISFGEEALPSITNSLAAGVIAFYLMGYGIAAFGVGPLKDLFGFSLKTLFGFSALIALLLGGLSFIVIKKQKQVGKP